MVDGMTQKRVCLKQDAFVCEQIYDSQIHLTELHTHPTVEICMVTAGEGIHRVLNQALPCRAGDIYILNRHVAHGFFASEDGERMSVRRLLFEPQDFFEGDILQDDHVRFCYGVFAENSTMAYAMVTQGLMGQVEFLYNSIAVEMLEKKGEWHDAVRAYLSLMLLTIGRYVNRTIKNVDPVDRATWSPVAVTMACVRQQYGDPDLTLSSIAQSLYMSTSRLSRLFKQVTGGIFADYVRNVRLSQACHLLKTTHLTVEEIMHQVGMRDATSFYKSFGVYTGMTPHTYRKTNQKGEKIMSILTEISENLQRGKAKIVAELVQTALDEGIAPQDILNEGLLHGMNIIGEKFKNNEVYVPEVLVAARAMNKGTAILKPHLIASGVQATGKVCIGTVQGDLHDIGKNLVKMMLEGKGLEVIDLGSDVAPETFVQTAIDEGCQVICLSALLTTTMGVMEDVVKCAIEKGVRDQVKIMIGGAPVNEDFCQKIGADIYTPDAASAADAAVVFCQK